VPSTTMMMMMLQASDRDESLRHWFPNWG